VIDLAFEVLGARAEPYAAEPTLMLQLRIVEADGRPVHAIALKCQIRIEPQRRRYEKAEEERLVEVFGETPRWGDSLRPFLWTHVSTVVGKFTGSVDVDLPVTCTYDFEIAASKYFHALDTGDIPLVLCFSGTAFAASSEGFSAVPVSWNRDASFPLPVQVWRDTMDLYFPNGGWVRLSRPTLDALTRFKAARALPTWDHTVEQLLKEAGEEI
jgi:hypothetical protein